MKLKILTQTNFEDYKSHGKIFIKSFLDNWPQIFKLNIYLEHMPMPLIYKDRIVFKKIDKLNSYLKFMEKNEFIIDRPINFKESFDIKKSAKKGLVLLDGIKEKDDCDYLVWISNNILTKGKITIRNIDDILPKKNLMTYIGRELIPYYSDTDFFIINLKSPVIEQFIKKFENIFEKNHITNYKNWNFNVIFDLVRIEIENKNKLKNFNITDKGLDKLIYNINKKNIFRSSFILSKNFDKINLNKNQVKFQNNNPNFIEFEKVKKNYNLSIMYYSSLFFSGLFNDNTTILEILEHPNATVKLKNFFKIKNYEYINLEDFDNFTNEKMDKLKFDLVIIRINNKYNISDKHFKIIREFSKNLIILFRDSKSILFKGNDYKYPEKIKNIVKLGNIFFKKNEIKIFNRFFLITFKEI